MLAGVPEEGDLFSVPLRVGGYGVALVIEKGQGLTFLVHESFWASEPNESDSFPFRPATRFFGQIAFPGHPGHFKGWFEGEVPSDFRVLSSTQLSPEMVDAARDYRGTMVFQNARHFARTLSNQWRWLNDREAYFSELEQQSLAVERAAQSRRERLSLKFMVDEDCFSGWADRWDARNLTKLEDMFRQATLRLIELEKEGTPRKRGNVLRKLVATINDLDNTTGLIESVERDLIVERVSELASLVGLSNETEQFTGKRTW